jgi:hypothetical protein
VFQTHAKKLSGAAGFELLTKSRSPLMLAVVLRSQ